MRCWIQPNLDLYADSFSYSYLILSDWHYDFLNLSWSSAVLDGRFSFYYIIMSSYVGLNSDASRPRSGILTPTSEGSLNSLNKNGLQDVSVFLSSGSKKRKLDELAHPMEDLLNPTIVIKVMRCYDLLPKIVSAT